jgi:hypothetical protein
MPVKYWDETSHERLPFGGVPLPMGVGASSVWNISTLSAWVGFLTNGVVKI